ncbi:unnamed protein product [Zymoseptoria tritici ST99CH_1A5]|uniref:Uncharacterized protein n=1 Tax=Zymoseptoria tritici ST99CH_1A5 TaxID=1276529 RepID=A0A1Y6LCP5_ZYMTR|nr:unnamed protein product [Zymoseptoria tritici ST99CH_1A5]
MLRYTGEVPDWDRARVDQENRVRKVIESNPSEADQLDAIAKIRGWYDPCNEENAVLSKYMAGCLSLEAAINMLAEPIDHLYTTANDGRLFYTAEMVARSQRHMYDTVKAEELWGLEQDFPISDEIGTPSVEGKLWCLWFAVCHTARKTPWADEGKQMKLVDFARQIKQRPDPPPPQNMTIPLKRDWQYSSGTLWSTLSMLGPSARETWNDAPGYGAGFSSPELNGANNINAFIARLSLHGVANFWRYGVWALDGGLAVDPREDHRGTSAEKLNAYIPTAVVWIRIAGQAIWEKIVREDFDSEKRYDANRVLAPQQASPQHEQTYTRARWRYWRDRYDIMSGRDQLAEETRKLCAEAALLMKDIEKPPEQGQGAKEEA